MPKLPWLVPASLTVCVWVAACGRTPDARKLEYLQSGDQYFDRGKYSEAAIQYRNAIQLDQRFGPARRGLAKSLEHSGNLPSALAEYVRAADLLPDDRDLQLTAGNYLLAARQFDDAKTRAELVLKADAKNVQAQVLLGNAFAGLRSFDEALKEFEEAIRIDPTRGATYTSLGVVETKRGRRAEAERAFQRAVELDPKWVPGHLALANHYWTVGRNEDAEKALRAAAALDPSNPATSRALALFYLASNRADQAEPFARSLAASGADPFALADFYLLQNRAAEAIPHLEQLRGTGREASLRLARAYGLRGDYVNAERVIDEQLQQDPKDTRALVVKGQLLAQQGKSDAALGALSAAAQVDPNSATLQFALGRSYAAKRDFDRARQAYAEVLRLNPRAASAQVEMARLDLLSGRVESSMAQARAAVRNEPANLGAQVTLVRGLLAAHRLIEAEKTLAALHDAYPDAPEVHVLHGLAAAVRNDRSGARQSFERALAADANNVEALASLVSLDSAAGNHAAARARVAARLEQHPDATELLMVAARAAAADKDLVSAERLLRHAVRVDPSFMPGYAMLGQLYYARGQLDAAQREFTTLAERQPKPIAALTMLGMIASSKNDAEEAIRNFERVIDLDPSAPVAANNLAWIYSERGERPEDALRLAQAASAGLPKSAEVRDTLGWVLYKRQSNERAVLELQEAVRLAPGNPTYLYHLGLAHLQQGDQSRAKDALRRALSLSAPFTGEADARRALSTLSPSNSTAR